MGPDPDLATAIRPLRARPRGKLLFSLEAAGAKASIPFYCFEKNSHESATVCQKIAISARFRGPPQRSPGYAHESPEIDLKSLWRSLRSFPHQRWGPQEHKPRDSMGRAAKPEQSAFSAVLGSDCSPLAKGAMYCT